VSILSWALLIFALLLVAVGAALIVAVGPVGWPLFIWGLVIAIAMLIERWRYQAPEPGQGAGWQATGERFEDPETGRLVEVLYDPATGRRRYVPARDQAIGH
jgi:hypothetical protein